MQEEISHFGNIKSSSCCKNAEISDFFFFDAWHENYVTLLTCICRIFLYFYNERDILVYFLMMKSIASIRLWITAREVNHRFVSVVWIKVKPEERKPTKQPLRSHSLHFQFCVCVCTRYRKLFGCGDFQSERQEVIFASFIQTRCYERDERKQCRSVSRACTPFSTEVSVNQLDTNESKEIGCDHTRQQNSINGFI